MKREMRTYYLAVLAIVAFSMASIFDLEGLPKIIFQALSIIVLFYTVATKFFPNSAPVRKVDFYVRKIEFFRIIISQSSSEAVKEGPALNKFKSSLLSFTMDQLGHRNKLIKGPDIFNIDFPIDFKPINGTARENQFHDWQNHLDKQFVMITGVSGNGKTFELMKRAIYLCKVLEPGIADHEILKRNKIPLYIELKSLNGMLDEAWIADYVSKSSIITRQNIASEQLKVLLDKKEIIYFFDGLDEVPIEYREEATKSIIAFSKVTGVHVSCRINIYEKLIENLEIFPENSNKPLQIPLKTLTQDWITEIILELNEYPLSEKKEMAEFIVGKPTLFEHLSRPILLNLFIKVYHSFSANEKKRLGSSDLKETMTILWENYEDYIFSKKLPKESDVLGIRTISVWLAKIMGNQSFYIESIQPSWLKKISGSDIEDDPLIQQYYYFTTRLFSAVIVGIALACIISTPFALVSASILGGILLTIFAGIYNRGFKKRKINPKIAKALLYMSMVIILSLACGVYQGFSVPRSSKEMYNEFFSITECWPGILLGITLSVIFSYRIINEHQKTQYILPVELFHFDWTHAFLYGLSWAFATSILTGSIALYVKSEFASGRFITNWLIPNVKKILIRYDIDPLVENNVNGAVFLYAFIVTFLVASIIIVLMAGRDPSKEIYDTTSKKQKLNFGIKKSVYHALRHALRVALTVFVFYTAILLVLHFEGWIDAILLIGGAIVIRFLFYDKIGWSSLIVGFAYSTYILVLYLENWVNGVMITGGVFLLVFLWFGGMEVMNHIVLRINLYIRGIAPLNYDTWVQAQQDMGLITPSGYQMSFYHPSLAEYYAGIKVESSKRIRLKRETKTDILIYRFIFSIFIILLIAPFTLRYGIKTYAAGIHDVNINSAILEVQPDSSYVFQKSGKQIVSVNGVMNVGTFVGWSNPKGTKYGFLGMPLDSAYNLPGLEGFDHAALIVRIKKTNQPWSSYFNLIDGDTLTIEKGERIEALVNDREWENNTGRYSIEFNPCYNCK